MAGCMVYVFLPYNCFEPSHYTPIFVRGRGMAMSSHPKIVLILPVMHQFALVAGYMAMYSHPTIVPILSIRPPIFVRSRFYDNVFPLYALSRTFYIGDRL